MGEEIAEFQEMIGVISVRRVSETLDKKMWSLESNEMFSIEYLTIHLSPSHL